MQTRAAQQQQDRKNSEVTWLEKSRDLMRFRELRMLAGSQLEEDEDRSLAELKEEVKDLDARERICKQSNEKETAVISLIVLQM